VQGIALAPNSDPNLFDLLDLSRSLKSHIFDINERAKLAKAIAAFRPEVVFHLAAQSLVRPSYDAPVDTFMTNVVGTVSLLDAVRTVPGVTAVVIVTSDKCYDNREWVWGYRESDRLGGRDPYSASKGCTEIAARSMKLSFFAPYAKGGHAARIATARAGNVIGGGDWSQDRLVPDIVRGCLGPGGEVHIRSPHAVRPWQHVLEPLSAYMRVAERLVQNPEGIDEAWNFGPDPADDRSVGEVAKMIVSAIGRGKVMVKDSARPLHEAGILRLDCSKAKAQLGWTPRLALADAVRLTAEWYLAWSQGEDLRAVTRQQIAAFKA